MEGNRHRVVGLLAGIPLFSGAWMTAFFNNPTWGFVGVLLTLWGLYVANRVERRTTNTRQLVQGAVAGLLTGIVARILGLLAGALEAEADAVSWTGLDDVFRVVLAGDWLASLLLIAILGVLGAMIAAIETDAKKPAEETKVTRTSVKSERTGSDSPTKVRTVAAPAKGKSKNRGKRG